VNHLDAFLSKVQPHTQHLLLIGGSAGWMMPPNWLTRFQRIDAYDIDPLAGRLFTWRHGPHLRQHGVQVTHHRQDALATLPELLREHPNACVWFDNVLGQHRFRVGDIARAEKELRHLKVSLQGRHWGSVHDVYSGPTDGQARVADIQPSVTVLGPQEADLSQALLGSVGAKALASVLETNTSLVKLNLGKHMLLI
jgi:hypothetical protein